MSHVQTLAAVTAASLQAYETASRRTGRTEWIVRQVEPGDQVVVSSSDERRHVLYQLRQARKEGIHVVVHDPSQGRLDNLRPATDGRTYFESTWCYLFFLQQVEEVSRSFYRFERHLNEHVEEEQPEIVQGPVRRSRSPRRTTLERSAAYDAEVRRYYRHRHGEE